MCPRLQQRAFSLMDRARTPRSPTSLSPDQALLLAGTPVMNNDLISFTAVLARDFLSLGSFNAVANERNSNNGCVGSFGTDVPHEAAGGADED